MGVKVDVEREVDTEVEVRVEVDSASGRPYVEIPAFGSGGSGQVEGRRIWRVRRQRRARAPNKGFARRPQEFLALEEGE